MQINKHKICVVGLGYVGLPLAIEFGKKYITFGFDVSKNKISEYQKANDPANEIKEKQFNASKNLTFSSDKKVISNADIIIIAVPTPIKKNNSPDLNALKKASSMVGKNMKKGSIVVYESTVYPGATEEVCIPILEKESNFKWKRNFNVGYSPERINPGDKKRTITKIIKVVSGDTNQTLKILSKIYGSIINAGVFQAKSIKVAEAAKVIENTQRDLNIALINELSLIFDRLNIDTSHVLEAANTKWNFLDFKPGLVGGHCIGVDPYYLTYKAKKINYHPEVILAGRKINDSMSEYLAKKILEKTKLLKINKNNIKITILGLTFKENCSDVRNSKVIELISYLNSFGLKLNIHDPYVTKEEVDLITGGTAFGWESLPKADILVYAVPHMFYQKNHKHFLKITKNNAYIFDIKSLLDKEYFRLNKRQIWSL
tara:strand:+ start:395 stop:1684 length:1290 start_codon:yes stop_codon:yes gene_type:complete